jgi:hypothetical protein
MKCERRLSSAFENLSNVNLPLRVKVVIKFKYDEMFLKLGLLA